MSVETTLNQENGAVDVLPPKHTRGGPYYRPNVDIYELPDQLVVLADVPGAKNDQIDIHFEDGALTIHAKVSERQDSQGPYLRQEYGVGDFYRTFRVSEQIEATRIAAEYSGGVLTLHLPKAEAMKPRKIKVSAK
ncbi:MAG TPA: Hsp20/alpha crystallin family protein [Pirellulales bacterium]|jgi:HSP20 family molecular chaperone IbpA|nr:Hsp20/alpha crystallin family protein [Pirellulales bacterium]